MKKEAVKTKKLRIRRHASKKGESFITQANSFLFVDGVGETPQAAERDFWAGGGDCSPIRSFKR